MRDDKLAPINYDPLTRKRRQDFEEHFFEENGSIYIFKPHILRDLNCRMGGKITHYLMDNLYSFQVDSQRDLDLMKSLLQINATRK